MIRVARPCASMSADTIAPSMALSDAENVDLVSKQVAECLGGKGGGRSGRYQGKAPQITQAQVRQAVIRMKIEMDAA